MRKMVIGAVLATDMVHHFPMVGVWAGSSMMVLENRGGLLCPGTACHMVAQHGMVWHGTR